MHMNWMQYILDNCSKIELNNPKVPRFVKTAAMIKDYCPDKNIVDYGFKMLKSLTVNDVPEWSIVFDVRNKNVYFKTRINPEVKQFSMNDFDFTDNSTTYVLNMDIAKGGDVKSLFHLYNHKALFHHYKHTTGNVCNNPPDIRIARINMKAFTYLFIASVFVIKTPYQYAINQHCSKRRVSKQSVKCKRRIG